MGQKQPVPGFLQTRKQELLICAALLAVILSVFYQASEFTVIGIDDTSFTSGNFVVQAGITWPGIQYAFTTNEMGSWHPLTWLSHMLDYQLFGGNLGRHHGVNILLHVLNTWGVFLLLRLATGALWRSAAVAALFAIHPMHVEPVVWLADRKGLLAALFWIASTLAWLLSLRRPEKVWKWRAASFVLFALGLMSKPVLVTLPFALVMLEYWPLGRFPRLAELPKAILEKAPFLLLTAVMSVITYIGQSEAGAMSQYGKLPVTTRLANAFHGIAMYLSKTFWPVDLAFNYTLRPLSAAEVALAVAVAVTLTALAVWRIRHNPYLAFGWFWFVGVLVPFLGLVQTGDQAYADRYTYVPHIGLFIAAVWGLHAVIKPGWCKAAWFRIPAGALYLLLLWTSLAQTSLWGDQVRFWTHTVTIVPHHVQGRQLLGEYYAKRGDFPNAQIHLNKALELDPKDSDSYRKLAELAFLKDNKQEALSLLDTAIRLKPDSGTAHHNRGLVLRAMDRNQEALEAFQKGLASGLEPLDQVEAHFQIGRTYHALGQTEQELASFRKVLELDYEHFMARKNLAFAYLKLKQFADAEREFNNLAMVAPNDPDVSGSLEYLQQLRR